MAVECWKIAYRKRQNHSTLLTDIQSPFITISNSLRYWAADPHLIEKNGRTWLFAELYDKLILRGVIGCCELTENGPTPWKIIARKPYHLSYPCIFSQGEEIFMIPESGEANKIFLWRALEFPYQWETVSILRENICALDSTPIHSNGKEYMFTLESANGQQQLNVYEFEERKIGKKVCPLCNNGINSRPAGRAFNWNGDLIRPSQDCSEHYGCALNFNILTQNQEGIFAEENIRKIKPKDIPLDCKDSVQGIHTYNFSEHYEVIDIKSYESRAKYLPGIVLGYIPRRILERKGD